MNNNPGHKKIWFWSDPHFYHRNVIKLCDRPFQNLDDMHKALIKNYNNCVGEDDICIWVGDCFFASGKRARDIMSQLNGKKIIVLGNHDRGYQSMMNIGFDWACYEMWLPVAHTAVQIKHYPMRPSWWQIMKFKLFQKYNMRYLERRPVDRGQFLIHGHTHQKDTFRGRQIHVGVDSNNFRPISLGQIEKYIREYNES